MKKNLTLIAAILIVLFAASGAFANDQYGKIINKANPGKNIDIRNYAKSSGITIFDFYSKYCGPCMKIGPLLEKLDQKNSNITVYKVDINRKGVRGIDWRSPAARQYKLTSIPAFVVFRNGAPWKRGKDATNYVFGMLQKSGLLK